MHIQERLLNVYIGVELQQNRLMAVAGGAGHFFEAVDAAQLFSSGLAIKVSASSGEMPSCTTKHKQKGTVTSGELWEC